MNYGWIDNINSYMTSYVWIRLSHIVMYEFSSLNSWMNPYMWILIWFHQFSRYFSWSWICIWIHDMNSYTNSLSWIHILHFMTYEFSQYSDMKSCIWKKSWNHLWNLGTKDQNVQASGFFYNQALNLSNWNFSAWESLKSINWRMYQKVIASAAGAQLTAGQGHREGTIVLRLTHCVLLLASFLKPHLWSP